MLRAVLVVSSVLCVTLAGCSRSGTEKARPAPAADAADPTRPLPSPLPDVVAVVNGERIRLAQILPLARDELALVEEKDRERLMPFAVRGALERYIDRELLFQEAVARGIEADGAAVRQAYDRARRDYPNESDWVEHLRSRGLDPQGLMAELRVQHTVGALLAQEVARARSSGDEAQAGEEAVRERLVTSLRARARVETSL